MANHNTPSENVKADGVNDFRFVRLVATAPTLRKVMRPIGSSDMHEPAKKQSGLRDAFPELSEAELESIARYFDLTLEIAAQDSIGDEGAFDISPSISTLKERSNSNLKDQS